MKLHRGLERLLRRLKDNPETVKPAGTLTDEKAVDSKSVIIHSMSDNFENMASCFAAAWVPLWEKLGRSSFSDIGLAADGDGEQPGAEVAELTAYDEALDEEGDYLETWIHVDARGNPEVLVQVWKEGDKLKHTIFKTSRFEHVKE